MPATVAYSGPGFKLQLGSAAGDSGVFTTVAAVKDISGPNITFDINDITNQDSPDGYEEIIPSLAHGGEVDFDCIYDPDNATQDEDSGLIWLANNKTKRGYRVLLQTPSQAYWSFDAYCVGVQYKGPVTNVETLTIKLRITGKPTVKRTGS